MALSPDFEAFRAGHDAGRNQVVWTRLAADLDTPVSLMLKLAGAARHSFMLESVTGGEVRGRYSIVGLGPVYHNRLLLNTLLNYLTGSVVREHPRRAMRLTSP